jgi:alpha-L-fucosidase
VHRREFRKLLAIAAASKAVPSHGQTAPESQSVSPGGFNRYTQDYAQFCALPPDKRVFYKVRDGNIVEERLDESAWQQSAWNYNPVARSVAGGLWDDVPVTSPIPDLAGDGPFKPTWDSLLDYEAPEWYRDAKFGIWAHTRCDPVPTTHAHANPANTIASCPPLSPGSNIIAFHKYFHGDE